MPAGFADKVEIEREIVLGGYLRGENLSRDEEVTEICLRVVVIDERASARVELGEVVGPLEVAHIHDSVPREQHPVASVAGWHHAVEHIHAPRDAFEQVRRSPHAHQVARAVLRQNRTHEFKHLIHLLRRLPHRKPPDGIALAVKLRGVLDGCPAQVRIDAALDYRKDRLRIAVERLRFVKVLQIALQPALGELQRFLRVLIRRVARTALVERHHYIRSDNALSVNIVLRSESMLRPVDVRAESAAFRRKFAHLREREHLKSAAVGKNRPVPVLELVEAAGLAENLKTRAQVEMVGVAEYNLGLDVLHQVPVVDALDGTYRPHGHEYRRLNRTVVCRNRAAPRR